MKKCRLCGVEKELSNFLFRKEYQKFRNECKECRSKQDREYNKKNLQKNRDRAKKYYWDNREYVLEYSKKHREEQKNKGRFGGNRFLVLERDGYKCQKCGASKNLVVHHLDGSGKDWSKETNNSLDNLQTLCRSCHIGLHHRKFFGCLISGCKNKHHAKGYCASHQNRREDRCPKYKRKKGDVKERQSYTAESQATMKQQGSIIPGS